ncbi:glutaminase [Haematospirillum sp. 15-248]|uniref:glutaminase n=1 Tax=Haematospirillum sp. 15-248 TaxID=2723107 RepID=UPI00143C2E4D|nr:glutaminase [Haematospirillum sp. 15-248]NKD88775.1 glutaminase [Haematospirillum sp. 15-248]
MDELQVVVDRVYNRILAEPLEGKVADYIPALACVAPDRFGIALQMLDGRLATAGDAFSPFSIQSISKLFSLVLALQTWGDELWERVGREPSGTAFNSLVLLEQENGLPRNPFINAGALAVTNAIVSRFALPDRAVIDFLGHLAGDIKLVFDDTVFRSEYVHGDRNRAIAYFLKAHGRMENPVEAVTTAYFKQCSIPMSCVDLARAGLFLATGGKTLKGNRILEPVEARQVCSLMLTCGLYDGTGDFSFRVGWPGKSGVGGGILAVIPGRGTACVWSPPLTEKGNSVRGMRALELLARSLENGEI